MAKQKSAKLQKRKKAPKARSAADTGANLGFEAKLWAAADALRNNMDAAEYKHVVLGLIFLKYVRAQLRVIVKRILRQYGYPPDKQEAATRTVIEQAEVLSQLWAA